MRWADGTRTYRIELRAAGDSHDRRVIVHKTEHGTPSHKYLPRDSSSPPNTAHRGSGAHPWPG